MKEQKYNDLVLEMENDLRREIEKSPDPLAKALIIIYVNRELNVSVGITGIFKPRIFDRIEFIEEKVLPVFLQG